MKLANKIDFEVKNHLAKTELNKTIRNQFGHFYPIPMVILYQLSS
jgi:hypothetical protein